MSNLEKVGVLLPLYKNDNPLFFKEAVGSILGQSYLNIKIFIGVDGPVGEELDGILSSYELNEKIKIVRFKENRGLAAVLNDLIKECKSIGCEFYARMDADDFCLPDRFDKQIQYLNNNSSVDVVGGAIEEIDFNSNKKGKKIVYPLTNEECRKFFRYRDPLAHPTVMFRASYFEKVKDGYRNEYRKNQDTMLWYDGVRNGCNFANINDTVLLFRITNDFYNRRNGWVRAKKMISDRWMINRELHYDVSAYIFALMMFVMTVFPSFIKKWLYKIR